MNRERIIQLGQAAPTYFELEGISSALCDFMQAAGGRTWAGWVGHAVKIRIQGVSRAMYELGIHKLVETTMDTKSSLAFVEFATNVAPMPALDRQIAWGTILRAPRLTKGLLFALPPGAFVVSLRLLHENPAFAEKLRVNRMPAWRRAKSAHAAGRRCYVAWSVAQFDEQRLQWVHLLP